MQDFLTGEKDPLLDPLIRTYYEANLILARTIAVKSSRCATEQNKALISEYGNGIVNFNNKQSWKYYLNLAGEYHPLDIPMTVISLDTQQQISFTKTILEDHPRTKSEYRVGSRYYQTLVTQYPTQEDLIMGILMPCDLTKAIEAEEGTILRYDTSLVEPNEYSLIKELEAFVKRHMFRYYIEGYSITDEYFLMSYFMNLYMAILPYIFNLREKNRNTHEVHSFHVRVKLRGYMGLDRFYPLLSQKQALYLYRNLPRLVRNIGLDSQFYELIENILTPRNIELLNYTIRQSNQITDKGRPRTVVKSELLNSGLPKRPEELLELEQLFEKEKTVLTGTRDFYDSKENEVKLIIERQNQSSTITKDVAAVSQKQVEMFSLGLEDIALSHWAYMSFNNKYPASVVIQNPRTGEELIVSAKNAFIYLYYLALSYYKNNIFLDPGTGIRYRYNVNTYPRFLARSHLLLPKVSLEELLSLVDQENRVRLTDVATQMYNEVLDLTTINDNQTFKQLCLDIYKAYINQHSLVSSQTDFVKHGYLRNMVYRIYGDTLISLGPNNGSMAQFLSSNNLDSYETVGTYFAQLFSNVFKAGTGFTLGETSNQRNITSAMLEIMKVLTSYNIQYIQTGSSVPLTNVDYESLNIHGKTKGAGSGRTRLCQKAFLPVGIEIQDVTVTNL